MGDVLFYKNAENTEKLTPSNVFQRQPCKGTMIIFGLECSDESLYSKAVHLKKTNGSRTLQTMTLHPYLHAFALAPQQRTVK